MSSSPPTTTRRVRRVGRREFASPALYIAFEHHVANAQSGYLSGDYDKAEREATMALRIRPTAHLFALLAAVAESKAQFDRASDLRLLQAFLAKNIVLWEELLGEFLSQQYYYKSVVCLQRLSALMKDPQRYRALQLQLADILVGLGEVRRAVRVLVPLWNSSRCRDFEVFGLLSSLYFQLGKWASLQRLIESSLKYAFHLQERKDCAIQDSAPAPSSSALTDTRAAPTSTEVGEKKEEGDSATKAKRIGKRVRFFGMDADPKEGEEESEKKSDTPAAKRHRTEEENDEFSFESMGSPSSPASSSSSFLKAANDAVIYSMYGERIELRTATEKKNFLTLVNVHAELLNERGHFTDTIQVLQKAAACLNVGVMELPPDLLVRLGVAYAFVGGEGEQPCRDVFTSLLETCPMEQYGDVLLDAAVSLQRVGMHAEAATIYTTIAKYFTFKLGLLKRRVAEATSALLVVKETRASTADVQSELDEATIEKAEVDTILAAAHHGAAQCAYQLSEFQEAEERARHALSHDAEHLQARLLLGRLYYYHEHREAEAVAVLTPHAHEPALHRLQLGAVLVRVFHHCHRYVEAIALGISIFEAIFEANEDGDTESVAPAQSTGSRRGHTLYTPSMTRASSAIVSAASLSGMASATGASSLAASLAGGGGMGRPRASYSLAASIRAGTSVAQQRLSKRGVESLTTTVYGASAAASVAAGLEKKGGVGEGTGDGEDLTNDASMIFRFHNRRRQKKENPAPAKTSAAVVEQRRQQRHDAVAALPATEFWKDEEKGDDDDPLSEEEEKVNNNDSADEEKKAKAAAPPPRYAGTNPGDRDRDLAELEAFAAEEEARTAQDGAPVNPEDDELPSIEELSKRFEDPAMASLFIKSSGFTLTEAEASLIEHGFDLDAAPAPPEGEGEGEGPLPDGGGDLAAGSGLPDYTEKVTIRDAIAAIGRVEFVALAVTVVDSYSALRQFTEAREFAFLALSQFAQRRVLRQMGSALERPLRLAVLRAALAAGEGEDAFRVGLRLLQEDTTEAAQQQVIELMHGVISRCEVQGGMIMRALGGGYDDVALLVLLANRAHRGRSYTSSLNYTLMALAERPDDCYLNFMAGLSYLLCSHQKRNRAREACVSAGLAYLTTYQRHRLDDGGEARLGEVLYNIARAAHFLKLYSVALPLYERVSRQLSVPGQCTLALQRAARVNLYFMFKWGSGNRVLALSALQGGGVGAAGSMC